MLDFFVPSEKQEFGKEAVLTVQVCWAEFVRESHFRPVAQLCIALSAAP